MIFSYPRWRYPISGSASVIVSPSIFTFMFQRPWVIGCWGPMFTQNSATSPPPRLQLPAADVLALRLLGEVLSQRVVPEVLGKEDPFHLRVAHVRDAHEVPRLPLMVRCRVPELREAVDLRVVVWDHRVDLGGRSDPVVVQVDDGLEMVLPVHRRDAGEMLEPEFLFEVKAHLDEVLPVDDALHDPGPGDAQVPDGAGE